MISGNEFEDVSCNLCGIKNQHVTLQTKDRITLSNHIFTLVKCDKCELNYINPRPRERYISKYYPKDYIPYGISKDDFFIRLYNDLLSSYYKKNKLLIDWFKSWFFHVVYNPIPYRYTGKILDVGCGCGNFLYGLKNNNWDVYGIDVSKQAVNYANKELRLGNVKQGSLQKIKYPSNYFDVITLNHSLEHLHNPRDTINEIHRIHKNNGLLIITTPNIKSINYLLFRGFWFPLETPRHLYLFDPITLKRLLNKCGYRVIKTSGDMSTSSLITSIKYRFNVDLSRLKLLLIAYTLFLSIIKRSDIFTIYAIKTK